VTISPPTPPAPPLPCVELTLFVSGASDLSARAITGARQLCDQHIPGSHLVVIDLNEDPAAAVGSGVLATPTLVRSQPLPVRRHVGDLSRVDKVLLALDLSGECNPAAPVR
jgi:circadian clock protein KaiB